MTAPPPQPRAHFVRERERRGGVHSDADRDAWDGVKAVLARLVEKGS